MDDPFKDIAEGTLIDTPQGKVMFMRAEKLPGGKFNPETRIFNNCMYRMFYKRKNGTRGHYDIDVS